ncbi:unnamed protein product [Chrysodeixis includens]|uniref:Cysteine proteinase n=1 Tax=Chrysodeixis includens TaxID=689277 RepID=A0A9P0BZU2_CHRIL|nr:unnamed protein product [Chrysodeixis includens]
MVYKRCNFFSQIGLYLQFVAMSSTLLLLLCACLLGLVSTRMAPMYESEHFEMHFERFIIEYNKSYESEHEKQTRFEIFKQHLEEINRLNEEHTHANFGVTEFSDMTTEEFVNTYTCLGRLNATDFSSRCSHVSDDQIPDANAPEAFDWRKKNVVTRIKHQHQCGSCYAFSSTGHIESQYAIKNQRLVELSEQQIVDCDRNSNGCQGGTMSGAFSTIINQGGIELESSYPYTGQQGQCRFQPGKAMVRLTGCKSYNLSSQEKLKQLLLSVGPIAIAVRAGNFRPYHGGIMTDEYCGKGGINHAVLLVGYGTENGHPYWLVKNSWGTIWGERGYFKVTRAEGSESCGIFNNFMATATIM